MSAEQTRLQFGDVDALRKAEREARQRRPIIEMHRRHGQTPGETCSTCAHMTRSTNDMATRAWKCRNYGQTNSAASDWRFSWPACGLWQNAFGGASSSAAAEISPQN